MEKQKKKQHQIKIELDDISFADHGVSGLEPVEPVFEEINWQAKVARISADTTQ